MEVGRWWERIVVKDSQDKKKRPAWGRLVCRYLREAPEVSVADPITTSCLAVATTYCFRWLGDLGCLGVAVVVARIPSR